MSVREYIGARYVPLFADPLTWDSTKTYEPLTVVLYQGNSFTSRQAVPAGIEITNESYWAQTGNYNAQVEQYREEVLLFDDRITANENSIEGIEANSWVTTNRIADDAITTDKIVDDAITTDKIVDDAITTDKIVDDAITTDKIVDDAITTNKIVDDAITTDKIDDESVTESKINSNFIEKITNKNISNYYWVYIDGMNGNDDNDGLSRQTPFRTLQRAFDLIKESEFDFRISIITSGTYSFTEDTFIGVTIHIYNDTGTSVVIDGPANVTFYQCHLNCGIHNGNTSTDTPLYFDIDKIIFDNCSCNFKQCRFVRIEQYGGNVYYNWCHFDSIYVLTAMTTFSGTCTFHNNDTSVTPIYCSNSRVAMRGIIKAYYISSNTQNFCYAVDCEMHYHGHFPGEYVGSGEKYYYAATMESSMLFINSNSLAALSNDGQNAPQLQYQTLVVKSDYTEL